MTRYILILGILVVAFLAYGCAATVQEPPATTVPPPPAPSPKPVIFDPCESVICTGNTVYVAGGCVCKPGFKVCGDTCIATTQCCTDNDCAVPSFCSNYTCSLRCTSVSCSPKQTCDENTGLCACPQGTKWCATQENCIQENACCSESDCRRLESCIPTITSLDICFYGQTTYCRSITEGNTKEMILDGKIHQVTFLKSNLFETADLQVDQNKVLGVVPDKNVSIQDFFLVVSKIMQRGGNCEKK